MVICLNETHMLSYAAHYDVQGYNLRHIPAYDLMQLEMKNRYKAVYLLNIILCCFICRTADITVC